MAILSNMWLKGARKRLGGTVVYNSMGQTIQRELATSVSNPRTLAQMRQRVKWANLVSFYRVNAPWMKYAFETKKRTQSEYNKLMSLNVASSEIYLTKQEAAGGACIVAPYIVTQGTLPSVEFTFQDDGYKTNLYLKNQSSMQEGTPVATLSASLVESNPALQYGDQISFIRLTQMTNGATGIPYVILRKYEMVLSRTNNEPWHNYLPFDLLSANESSERGWIEVDNNNAAGGFTIVISRTVGGRTLVSTQSIMLMNMDAIIASYSSQAALERAVASYGTSEDAFLSSNAANYGDDTPIDLAINYVEIGGKKYMANDYVGPLNTLPTGQIKVYFNQNCGQATQITVDSEQDSIELTSLAATGNVAVGTISQKPTSTDVLQDISVEIGSKTIYMIYFSTSKPSLPDLS